MSSSLGSAVTREMVRSLMTARSPELLDPSGESDDPDGTDLFETSVRGIATEVQPYVGSAKPNDEATSARWDLAVWAVTLGVAAQLEASLFPEQQGYGDAARAEVLERRYRAALAQLAGRLPGDSVADGSVTGPASPSGSFPPPRRYPDPALEVIVDRRLTTGYREAW